MWRVWASGRVGRWVVRVGMELVVAGDGALPGLSHPAAAAFVAAVGGEPSPKFGWTDVARFTSLGVPAVNFGPGNPSLAHHRDEFTPVTDLFTVRDALHRWLTTD